MEEDGITPARLPRHNRREKGKGWPGGPASRASSKRMTGLYRESARERPAESLWLGQLWQRGTPSAPSKEATHVQTHTDGSRTLPPSESCL